MNPMSVNKLTTLLGCADLLPFMAALLASVSGASILSNSPRWLFASYSAVILSFLCGGIWGRLLSGDSDLRSKCLLVVSNFVALLAWVSLLSSGIQLRSSIALLGLGYLVVLACELIAVDRLYHGVYHGYLRLRWGLTIAVVAMHVLMFLTSV